jgi:hypothetical protein
MPALLSLMQAPSCPFERVFRLQIELGAEHCSCPPWTVPHTNMTHRCMKAVYSAGGGGDAPGRRGKEGLSTTATPPASVVAAAGWACISVAAAAGEPPMGWGGTAAAANGRGTHGCWPAYSDHMRTPKLYMSLAREEWWSYTTWGGAWVGKRAEGASHVVQEVKGSKSHIG